MIGESDIHLQIVDVCGTLVREDTTLGLLTLHFSRGGRISPRLVGLRLLIGKRSPLRLGVAVLEKLTGQHLLKHAAVLLLAGESAAALDKSADKYADVLLESSRLSAVSALIEESGARNRIVLASASLEPIVRALAHKLGAEYVASELEQSNGILTGRYALDLTGIKEQALRDKFGTDVLSSAYLAVSDNLTDRNLLENAARAFVVLHKEKHRSRWLGVQATFLEIFE